MRQQVQAATREIPAGEKEKVSLSSSAVRGRVPSGAGRHPSLEALSHELPGLALELAMPQICCWIRDI